MAVQVAWSESALASLSEAIEYIAKDSPSYAAALAVQAERAGMSLQELARVVPEYKDSSVPEIPAGSRYRLIYKAEGNHVSIIAFVHTARDLASFIEETSW